MFVLHLYGIIIVLSSVVWMDLGNIVIAGTYCIRSVDSCAEINEYYNDDDTSDEYLNSLQAHRVKNQYRLSRFIDTRVLNIIQWMCCNVQNISPTADYSKYYCFVNKLLVDAIIMSHI